MSSPWRQPVPCDNCPFNSEGEGLYLRRSLARGRFQQICDDLKAGLTFNCHKTTHETGDGTELVCAGAIKWSNDRGYSSNFQRVMERLDYIFQGSKVSATPADNIGKEE
jgi:hypothetical protein